MPARRARRSMAGISAEATLFQPERCAKTRTPLPGRGCQDEVRPLPLHLAGGSDEELDAYGQKHVEMYDVEVCEENAMEEMNMEPFAVDRTDDDGYGKKHVEKYDVEVCENDGSDEEVDEQHELGVCAAVDQHA